MNANGTAKQQAVAAAMIRLPRFHSESPWRYAGRLAAMSGVSQHYIVNILYVQECAALGAEIRRKEEAERKAKLLPTEFTGNLGMVTSFNGWPDFFFRLKLLSEVYMDLARSRHDAYAEAFLLDVRDIAERAHKRSRY